jgi:hypothetical protein
MKENVLVRQRILGTFVGKRKQTILKKHWFDITTQKAVQEMKDEEAVMAYLKAH